MMNKAYGRARRRAGGYGKCLVRSPIVMHVLSGGQLTKLRNQHFLISGPSPHSLTFVFQRFKMREEKRTNH